MTSAGQDSENRGLIATILNAVIRIGFVVATIFVAYTVYSLLLSDIFNNDGLIVPFILLWLLTAYVVLPRIHRFLTKIYLPNYFVGRTRNGDGLYADPVNLAFYGTGDDIIAAMKKAGWTQADELNWRSTLKMIKSTILRRSYPQAPVSSLFLFSRKQDFAFQQEINGNPHARHHIRFWRVPEGWRLPGGHTTDWLAAGTYDTSVGLSFMTLQITHKIAANIDEERDYVIQTLQETGQVKELQIVEHFTTAYHTRNGGGDRIETDGSLPFITLRD